MMPDDHDWSGLFDADLAHADPAIDRLIAPDASLSEARRLVTEWIDEQLMVTRNDNDRK